MSLWETIAAEMKANAPAYPSKGDFTKVFGFKGHQTLGSFPSIDAAVKAGATDYHSVVDRDAYEAARKEYRDHGTAMVNEFKRRLASDYPKLNDAAFEAIYKVAYSEGHSAGFHEVETYFDTYYDMAMDVHKALSGAMVLR